VECIGSIKDIRTFRTHGKKHCVISLALLLVFSLALSFALGSLVISLALGSPILSLAHSRRNLPEKDGFRNQSKMRALPSFMIVRKSFFRLSHPKFQTNFDYIIKILLDNGYPLDLIFSSIRRRLLNYIHSNNKKTT